MILNQTHPNPRDVTSGARIFLNQSKTSFDIASLVSSGSDSLHTAMSPRDSISPDGGTNKSIKMGSTTSWQHQEVTIPADEIIPQQEYHGHKKYRHRRRFDPLRIEIPNSRTSPRPETRDDDTDKASPASSPPTPMTQPTVNSHLATSPASAFQRNMPDSQILKAMAAGVLQFPFPYFGTGQPSATSSTHFSSSSNFENSTSNPKTPVSPLQSPSILPLSHSSDASLKSTESIKDRSSTSPQHHGNTQTNSSSTSFTFPSMHSPLLSSAANSDMDCFSRQAFLHAAAANPGFPTANHLPGLSGSFMPTCFPRISTNPIGASAFDATSNMALRSAFCPPHTPPASYNPWLLRQAAASVRPFPPHLAGELST